MAQINMKHALDGVSAVDTVVELRGPKRQRTDDRNVQQGTPQPLISEDQKFWTAVAEPPDINYWEILERDYENFKRLLSGKAGYTGASKYLMYQIHELDTEVAVLSEYSVWIEAKQETAQTSGDEKQRDFWKALSQDVKEDRSVVDLEHGDAQDRLWPLSLKLYDKMVTEHHRQLWEAFEKSAQEDKGVVSESRACTEQKDIERSGELERWRKLCERLGSSKSGAAEPVYSPDPLKAGDRSGVDDGSENDNSSYVTANESSPSP